MKTVEATITSSASANKIAIFYHVYQHANWRNFVNEQFGLLVSTGLADYAEHIHIGVNGSHHFEITHPAVTVHMNTSCLSEETPTLESLRDFSKQNKDYKILYFHTKGITQPMQSTHDWRKIMEYYCIERWQECVEKLSEYDAAGCLYMGENYYGYFPHFSGNFWWANAEYVNRLDDSYLNGGIRQNREFWIGSGNGKLFSFHTTGLNHYAHEYPRSMYAD